MHSRIKSMAWFFRGIAKIQNKVSINKDVEILHFDIITSYA
ncbi:MAG: hypothetical protein QHH15_02615 [Candidatus Thermoplasmatota archaeon]|nr:hypothetical protein [Candidatus Thermoplasmatota archaeon]